MEIKVVTGVGIGKTLLSAFDAALKDCGVYNYNLIVLSSIIPPHSQIERVEQYQTPPEEYGYKLYIIKAENRSETLGEVIGAGIGWYQLEDNRGMFVEHNFTGQDKDEVEKSLIQLIKDSLKDLCQFRGFDFDESKVNTAISVTAVGNTSTCVLALSIYQSQGWE
ncbi:MAG: pyruvoyl-dependent arginine decarboxylase [bacterium]|nr:pyruvoyl-dependent arginine decarboxylase [bacterium]